MKLWWFQTNCPSGGCAKYCYNCNWQGPTVDPTNEIVIMICGKQYDIYTVNVCWSDVQKKLLPLIKLQ